MTRIARSAVTLFVPVLLAVAAPSQARAADCGVEYLVCVSRTVVDINSSDVLHERQCYSEYIGCVALRLIAW
ncbi:MAG: hypothetical protein ACN0LA_07805 [Candidatus Longimicrobiales bacterium M2_2A_002]